MEEIILTTTGLPHARENEILEINSLSSSGFESINIILNSIVELESTAL